MGKLERGIELGYIVEGWTLADYIRYAIEQYGWESFVIWGSKGGGKSSLMLQIGYLVYKDWETVLEHVVFEPMDFIRITEGEGRIPWIGWDDIGVHLPRSLYFTNRDLWAALKQNWDAFRVKLNVFVCTTPNKAHVASFILDDLTGEIYVGRRFGYVSTYDFQRWVWSFNFKNPQKTKAELVRVEYKPLPLRPEEAIQLNSELPGVPTSIFKKYWKRRVELAEKARKRLKQHITKLERKYEEPPPIPEDELRKASQILLQARKRKRGY